MTILDAAREIAVECGHPEISQAELEWLIWNRTGFPSFYAVGESFDSQLRAYFAGEYFCGRCGVPRETDDSGWNFCDSCSDVMLASTG